MSDWKHEIRGRLAELKLEENREVETAEELEQHLEQRYEELLSRGATAAEATRDVLAELSDALSSPKS